MSDATIPVPTESPRGSEAQREFSGTRLIIGMFVFGTLMASGMLVYWYFHTLPFQPLQLAIANAIPKSYPRVEGGQRKMHRDSPKMLRITLRVEFNPEPHEADSRIEPLIHRLVELAKQHLDFNSYESFEVHLIRMRPEHTALKRTVTRKISEL